MKALKIIVTAFAVLVLLAALGFGYAAIWLPDPHDSLFNTAFLTLMLGILAGALAAGLWGADA